MVGKALAQRAQLGTEVGAAYNSVVLSLAPILVLQKYKVSVIMKFLVVFSSIAV